MSRGYDCFGHRHVSLVPIESHHVHPTQYHGPNTAANRRNGCANAHSDTHYLLEALLKSGGHVEWALLRTYGPGVREVAMSGYRQVMAYAESLTPKETP